ncbi:MAG: hypothetical protein ACM33T_00575 [Solirubrobacterales bacterium]
MKIPAFLLACLLPLAVTACGVPDLVAHGIKEVEKSRDRARQDDIQPVATQPREVEPRPAVVREEPPPADTIPAGTVPRREAVTVEPLR